MRMRLGLILALLLPLSAHAETFGAISGFAQARLNDGQAEAELGICASAQVSDTIDMRLIATAIIDGMDDTARVNIGLLDWHTTDSAYGVRIGRVQQNLGFYTETLNWAPARDLHLPPQGIYRENFHYFLRSGDGVQPYVNFKLGDARINLEATYNAKPVLYQPEELARVYLPFGTIDKDSTTYGLSAVAKYHITTLRYDYQHLDLGVVAHKERVNVATSAHYIGLRQEVTPAVDFTAEYLYIDKQGEFPNDNPAMGGALSASWAFLDYYKLTGGYTAFYYDIDDRRGQERDYSEDAFLGIKYRRGDWVSTAEVHHIKGLATASYEDFDARQNKIVLTLTRVF